jgi:tetratricopeptide (TPR) repeat protein
MATKKNLSWTRRLAFLLGLVVVALTGCGPPGPRAFKEGQRLMEQGRYAPAVEQFTEAARLMATNALAWNYLGLACQHAGQVDAAVEAYQKALKYDRNLFIVHYNLGCLWLEQNRPDRLEPARNELTTYAMHQDGSLPGWLKLGTVQLRMRDLVAAETSFRKALLLSPDHPEALNGLGLVELQRNRYRDAANDFTAALAHHPKYGPALLNLAVVSQTYLNNRQLALQKYQEYLALSPRPVNAETVAAAARQLEQELNPPARPATNVVTAPVRPVTNNPVNLASGTTNPARSETPVSPPKPAAVPPARPEIVQLPAAPVVKTAGNAASAGTVADSTATTQMPDDLTPVDPEKRGFLQRMNPFRRDPKSVPTPTPLPESGGVDEVARTSTASAGPLPIARYTYLSPAKPAEGNRRQAEQFFAQAAEAQHDRRSRDAFALYRAATQADPAYFEAQSNLGLAAFDFGDMTQSLLAYETALAIKPESFSARFNFSLALRKAGYLLDAAQELERLIAVNPSGESPAHLALAHLTLANLYADQFRRPSSARPHYLKVLELDPQNSEATAIRYWLRDNP